MLNIDEVQRERGYVNDKAKNDRHVYSGKAPGASFVFAGKVKVSELPTRRSPEMSHVVVVEVLASSMNSAPATVGRYITSLSTTRKIAA